MHLTVLMLHCNRDIISYHSKLLRSYFLDIYVIWAKIQSGMTGFFYDMFVYHTQYSDKHYVQICKVIYIVEFYVKHINVLYGAKNDE